MAANPIPPPDRPLRLIMPKAVPAGWPPDVVPRQLIESEHMNLVKSSVYQWPGNVNGGGHDLAGVGRVDAGRVYLIGSAGITDVNPGTIAIVPAAGGSPLNVFNQDGARVDWTITGDGNLISATERGIYSAAVLSLVSGGLHYAAFNMGLGGVGLASNVGVYWFPTTDWSLSSADLLLSRAGPGALQIGNPAEGGYGDVWLRTLNASSVVNAYAINASGDVNAGRNLNVTGAAKAGYFYGPIRLGVSQFVEWTAGAVDGAPDVAIGRRAAGMLHVTNNTGGLGDLTIANLATSVNVVVDGVIFCRNYISAITTDGIPRATLWGPNVGFAATGVVRWSQSDNFYDVADVTLQRSNPGDLVIHGHPDLDNMGGLQVGDLTATRAVFAHSFSTPGGIGYTGNFTISGKTIFVSAGIITSVVG